MHFSPRADVVVGYITDAGLYSLVNTLRRTSITSAQYGLEALL